MQLDKNSLNINRKLDRIAVAATHVSGALSSSSFPFLLCVTSPRPSFREYYAKSRTEADLDRSQPSQNSTRSVCWGLTYLNREKLNENRLAVERDGDKGRTSQLAPNRSLQLILTAVTRQREHKEWKAS
jgi:hypothetical protein